MAEERHSLAPLGETLTVPKDGVETATRESTSQIPIRDDGIELGAFGDQLQRLFHAFDVRDAKAKLLEFHDKQPEDVAIVFHQKDVGQNGIPL